MILNACNVPPSAMRLPSTMANRSRRRISSFPLVFNENRIDTELLRTQLDQLHAEAAATRSKANNIRLRLMRLSETAENLQQRAAANVLVGKESEARELLIQKKKLMQALEKSKNRIGVFDTLAAKINEVISLKETQLIGHIAMHLGVKSKDPSDPIRVIPPKDVTANDSNKNNVFDDPDSTKSGANQELSAETCEVIPTDSHQAIIEEAASIETSNDDNLVSILKGISSYGDFLEYVDWKLREVEVDLDDFLRISTLILDNEQKQMNIKVRQTSEILEDVHNIRRGIASIMHTKSHEG